MPEDLQEVYEAVYDLVTQDPKAMPKDGDFITGRTSPADMAARMLAARVPAPKGPAAQPAEHRHGPHGCSACDCKGTGSVGFGLDPCCGPGSPCRACTGRGGFYVQPGDQGRFYMPPSADLPADVRRCGHCRATGAQPGEVPAPWEFGGPVLPGHGAPARPTVPGSDDAAIAAGPSSSAQQPYEPCEGDRVRARRYEQPTPSRGDPDRKLIHEWTGTAAGPHGMRVDGGGEHGGEYLDFRYVFLGGSPEDGTCAYLVTDVELLPPAVTTQEAPAVQDAAWGALACPSGGTGGTPHYGHNIWASDGNNANWRHRWCPGTYGDPYPVIYETETELRHDQEIAAEAAQAAPAPGAGTDGTSPQAPEAGPAFDAAEADSQMHAAIGRNDGWRFEMVNPRNGADGHRYRYTSYGRHTGTIEVTAEGFRWETASHRDGTPLASGTTTAIAEAFRAVTSGEPAGSGTGTWARAATAARLASFNAQLAGEWRRRAEQTGYLRAAYGIDPDKVSYLALAGRPGEVAALLSQAQEHLLNRRFAAMDRQLAAAVDDLAGCPGARGARVRQSVTELRERLQARLGKPEVIGLADGQTRQVTRRWPDGSWACPWCESPAMAGEALAEWSRGCPNPACPVNMSADQLADSRRREEAEAARRREAESISKFMADQAAEGRQREADLWIAAEAEAQKRGACIQCLRKSGWRSGRPKFVRHRSEDHHGAATTAPEAQ